MVEFNFIFLWGLRILALTSDSYRFAITLKTALAKFTWGVFGIGKWEFQNLRRNASMSALGHKRTSRAIVIYVRYWGQSGHPKVTVGVSPFECLLLGVKRTFASYPLDVCL